MKREHLTRETLMEMLDYDPETGVFTWRCGRTDSKGRRITRFAGAPAGTLLTTGHLSIYLHIPKKHFLAHRLAWLYVHGVFPPHLIDHINGDPSDNRIVNLRPATRSENAMNAGMWSNNTSGYKGIHHEKKSGLWLATVKKHGKIVFKSTFECKQSAIDAVRAAREKFHGEFANHG